MTCPDWDEDRGDGRDTVVNVSLTVCWVVRGNKRCCVLRNRAVAERDGGVPAVAGATSSTQWQFRVIQKSATHFRDRVHACRSTRYMSTQKHNKPLTLLTFVPVCLFQKQSRTP